MIENLFFSIAPAIKVIFQLGYEPKRKYFYELTNEQYERLKRENIDISSKLYLILPDEYKHQTYDAFVVTEHEKESLLKASIVVSNYCNKSDVTFKNYGEKLKYVSNLLPPVFTENSNYKRTHLRLVGHE